MPRAPLKEGRRPLKERARRQADAPQFAVANDIRLAALTLLHERPLSPGQIADVLGEDVKVVTHHMRELYDAGCVEFVGHQGGGNLRRAVYRAIVRPYIGDEEYQAMSLDERTDLNGTALQWIIAESLTSYRSGRMSRDDNTSLLSDEPTLDLQGRKELHDLLDATWAGDAEVLEELGSVQDIATRAANRMASSGETGTKVVLALLAFERGR